MRDRNDSGGERGDPGATPSSRFPPPEPGPDARSGLRIGLIVPGFSADETDWCIPALRDLVRELAVRHQVQVFALRYPHQRGSYRVEGARVHAFGGALARRGARVGLLGRAVAHVAGEHRRRPMDVLHGMWADEPGLVAVTVARLSGVPALVSLMGGELAGLPESGYGGQLSRVNRAVTRHVLRRASRVTAGSAYLCRLAASQPLRHPVARLPLGVDTRRFRPDPEPGEETPFRGRGPQLLSVASLSPVKDQETLLQALALAVPRVPEIHLHLVGDGPLRGDLEAQAAALGLSGKVTFHGSVPHHRLPPYYRGADLCVLSSRHESQGMVVLEAAACGRTTVGTAVGILPELAPATQAVPVGDARGLADALVALLREPSSLAIRGRRALGAVREGYALERSVADLCSLYGTLLES